MSSSSSSAPKSPANETAPVDQDRRKKLKEAYTGQKIEHYEEWRSHTRHWRREQQIVEQLLDVVDVETDDVILDVPVGTGRFFPLYAKYGPRVVGVDISTDMLSEAREKAADLEYDDVDLRVGDILDLELEDEAVDLSVCIRLMNWFDFPGFRRSLRELRRVSSRFMIVGVRLASGRSRFEFLSWLKEAPVAWGYQLKAAYNRTRHSLASVLHSPGSEEPPSSDDSGPDDAGPTLVDHPEPAVRKEFQRLDLEIVQDRQALTFSGTPRLSTFFLAEERPYHIFLLRVAD